MCLRAIKTQHYSQRVPIVGTVGYNIGFVFGCVSDSTLFVVRQFRAGDLSFKQLSSFEILRRKGGKFDSLPRRPKVLLRQ